MRSALVRSLLSFPSVAILLAACWQEPRNFVDTPRPGAPAYWESGISAEGAPSPRNRDGGVDGEAGAETSDELLRERAQPDAGPAPPSAQTPGGSLPEEPFGHDDGGGI